MRDLESFVSGYISIGFTNKGICIVLLKERICKKLGLFGRKCLTYLGKPCLWWRKECLELASCREIDGSINEQFKEVLRFHIETDDKNS